MASEMPPETIDDPEGVLSPEELEVEQSDKVEQLDENRYVVTGDSEPVELSEEFKQREQSSTQADSEEESRFVEEVPDPFAVSMEAKTTHGIDEMQLKGSDITSVFEAVARWYANQLEPDLPPEKVLELVVNESELDLEVKAVRPD